MDQVIVADYHDGKNRHELTLMQCMERFESMGSVWWQRFTDDLLHKGRSVTAFAVYSVKDYRKSMEGDEFADY